MSKKRFMMMESKYIILFMVVILNEITHLNPRNQLLLQQRKKEHWEVYLSNMNVKNDLSHLLYHQSRKYNLKFQSTLMDQGLMLETIHTNGGRYTVNCTLCGQVLLESSCVPATSIVSERVFSKSGKIVTPARCALEPDKVEMLVFLAKNVYRN